MKVGVFGGTFDPIHVGHLIGAEHARVQLGLDHVLFLPTGQPWLKAGQSITEARHRMAMVDLAVRTNCHFRASDREVKRPGPTYTVDTLEELRRELDDSTALYLVLGVDSLGETNSWHLPGRVFDMAKVVGLPRPGFGDFDPRSLDAIRDGASSRVMLLDGPLIEISGTDLRRRVATGESIKYLVPEAVEAYIYEHGLYSES